MFKTTASDYTITVIIRFGSLKILVFRICFEFRYSNFEFFGCPPVRPSFQDLINLFNATRQLLTFGLCGTNFFHGPQNLQGILIYRRVHHFAFVGNGSRAFGDTFFFEDRLDTFGPFYIIG